MKVKELKSLHIAGQPVRQFELSTDNGMCVRLMEYGATVLSVAAPDKFGQVGVVTLGLEDPRLYESSQLYFGVICGRVANRISGAAFELDGQRFGLNRNHGRHHLHGGEGGFHRKIWMAEEVGFADEDKAGVRLRCHSADGESGYPGELFVDVTYTLSHDHRFQISYEAQVQGSSTVVNLTNHTYWNLAGGGSVLGHHLQVNADRIVETDEELIPTGQLLDVAGTEFDFRTSKSLGHRIDALENGYDNCYNFDDEATPGSKVTASLSDPVSGRVMQVITDQPGMQLYSSGFLDGSDAAGGHQRFGGVCLECQQLPDAPNRPEFPSIQLEEGETYRQQTAYQFSVQPD